MYTTICANILSPRPTRPYQFSLLYSRAATVQAAMSVCIVKGHSTHPRIFFLGRGSWAKSSTGILCLYFSMHQRTYLWNMRRPLTSPQFCTLPSILHSETCLLQVISRSVPECIPTIYGNLCLCRSSNCAQEGLGSGNIT